MRLEDGTGANYKQKIDSGNRAWVKAMSDLTIAVKSFEDGDAYQLFVPSRTLGGSGEHNLLYFKNTSETRSFAMNKYFLSFGPTSANTYLTVRQYLNPGVPSANETLSGAGNLFTSSGNTATLTVYYWDEVGTAGMTATAGQQAGEVIVTAGTTSFDLQGSTIIGPGDSLMLSSLGASSDEVAMTIEGYFL